jgi:CheY-like chemotaxis protein
VKAGVAVILIIDDEFSVAEVVEAILTDAGHEVVTASNGQQGLERAKEKRPDLVLLDFMMPIMGGPSTIKALREEPGLRDVPVVVMSSLPEAAVSQSTKGEYVAFLRKPFRIREVIDVVNNAIGDDQR